MAQREVAMRTAAPAQRQIEQILGSAGVSVYGYADVTGATSQLAAAGREAFPGAVWAVSIGIALPNSIVDRLASQSAEVSALYKHHAYDVINARLDLVTSHLAQAIEERGFTSLPVPASQRTDQQTLGSLFPHRTAAHLAGLGWIGKSCLLVTPQYGPRVRLATVLTDLPLQPIAERIESRCGGCTQCFDICPVQAFTGRPFHESEAREMRFDATACNDHMAEQKELIGSDVCGLCLYICPFGRARS